MGDGSDVAREAADMVLLENFEAIVVALEYGEPVAWSSILPIPFVYAHIYTALRFQPSAVMPRRFSVMIARLRCRVV